MFFLTLFGNFCNLKDLKLNFSFFMFICVTNIEKLFFKKNIKKCVNAYILELSFRNAIDLWLIDLLWNQVTYGSCPTGDTFDTRIV